MPASFIMNICCIGAGYVGGPTMAMIALKCPDITVTVVEIRGDKVRLGIVAPKEVPVHRQEVYDAIHGKPDEPAPSAIVSPKPLDSTGRV